ncbi:hypothetical protein GGR54DRAFT_642284 [Hypoxylon sp. NC1633]|nr:hypothetical protein GGR54DRAFT_642284 [Hypoxylon sp. NC1633]
MASAAQVELNFSLLSTTTSFATSRGPAASGAARSKLNLKGNNMVLPQRVPEAPLERPQIQLQRSPKKWEPECMTSGYSHLGYS